MAQLKLSPRQKMINMMYLVLTALLALNVSKETLDVIAKVEKSLNQTIENFTNQNNLIYADFSQANMVNPEKVGPFKDKADLVKIESQALIDKITKNKWLIVKEADGEDGKLDSIKSMEDVNVPAQIMLTEKPINFETKKISRGLDLRKSIDAYREFLINQLDSKDSVLIRSIESALELKDITTGDEKRSWEQDNFEYLPLIGVITLMSKMQSDIRNAESNVLTYLYSGIDEESFKFNDLMAAVIPTTSSTVVLGNPYEIDIFLAARDSTQDPEIFANNQRVTVKDGVGTWRTVPTRLGTHTVKGHLNYLAPDGRTLRYEYEKEFNVIPPVLIVSPTKMNVFYKGLDNPVLVNVPGADPGSIVVNVSNATSNKGEGYEYIIKPTQDYGESVVKVSAAFDGKRQQMPDQRFRLKRVPPPLAKIRGKNGGSISKSDLSITQGVSAVMDDFLFDIKFTITKFTVVITKNQFIEDEPAYDQYFTDKQRALFGNLKTGDRFFIEDIYADGPNGEVPLTSIIFKIQ